MGYINTSIFVLLFDRLLFRQLLQLFVEPFFVVVRSEFAGSLLEAFELTFAFGHAALLNMHNFTVFIDESGDEGFVFRDPPEKGSSDWFIVSAVVSLTDHQSDLRLAGEKIREAFEMPPHSVLHFTKLSHERRLLAIDTIMRERIRFVSVLIDKRNIRDVSTFTAQRGRLYYYAVRLLLERVSWLCRDTANRHRMPSPKARIIFEHRRRLKHDDLVSYVRRLKNLSTDDAWLAERQEDIQIHWPVIDDGLLEAARKEQYVGVQYADFVASGLKMGLEHTQYGFTEHRYAKALVPRTYERAGNYLSYGLKFFPSAPHETNAFMHWVYKHCRG